VIGWSFGAGFGGVTGWNWVWCSLYGSSVGETGVLGSEVGEDFDVGGK
jgi:hypothetical protein